jgi:hypothetical protein
MQLLRGAINIAVALTAQATVERSLASNFHFAIRWSLTLRSAAEGWAQRHAVGVECLRTALRARVTNRAVENACCIRGEDR